MKRKTITVLLFLAGMTVFAQNANMSYYLEEFQRATGTFRDRLLLLRTVQDRELTGIGEFYHEALKYMLLKSPDIKTREEREDSENTARIICRGLAAEKYSSAAFDLWQLVLISDVVRDLNDGIVMQDALVALGQTGDKSYVSNIALRLDNFNTDVTSDAETRRRIQRGVAGCIFALEALHEVAGYTSVFFASIGWYDPSIKTIAYDALPNIADDPGEVVSAIVRSFNNNPDVKYTALQEMMRTRAPNSSKSAVAAVALDSGWLYSTNNPYNVRILGEMRMSAIDIIRQLGVTDNSVYANLDKSYTNNFMNSTPNYDEIRKTLSTLSIIKTDEAVQLLVKFLGQLNERRRIGPWGNKERNVFSWVVPSLGATKTQSEDAVALLTAIQRSPDYTVTEQNWARDALREIGQ